MRALFCVDLAFSEFSEFPSKFHSNVMASQNAAKPEPAPAYQRFAIGAELQIRN